MSAALYIALEARDAGVSNAVNGKALSRAEGDLTVLASQLGIRPLMDFFSMSAADYEAMVEHNSIAAVADLRPHEERWFLADEGLQTIRALIAHLQAHPAAFPKVGAVLSDLEDFAHILDEARKHGVRWHLSVDY